MLTKASTASGSAPSRNVLDLDLDLDLDLEEDGWEGWGIREGWMVLWLEASCGLMQGIPEEDEMESEQERMMAPMARAKGASRSLEPIIIVLIEC